MELRGGEAGRTFDQDSPWVEHPVYTQAMFALERLHTLAPQHSDWRKKAPVLRCRAFPTYTRFPVSIGRRSQSKNARVKGVDDLN